VRNALRRRHISIRFLDQHRTAAHDADTGNPDLAPCALVPIERTLPEFHHAPLVAEFELPSKPDRLRKTVFDE